MSFLKRRRRSARRRVGSALEVLEARRVLASYFVTTPLDTIGGSCVADDQTASIDCSLRDAVAAATSSPGPNTVVVPAGVYRLSLGVIAAEGSDPLTIVGNPADAGSVRIDAQGNDQIFEFWLDSFSSVTSFVVTLNGLTLENGWAIDDDGGGAVATDSGVDLRIHNSVLEGNRAGSLFVIDGGAIEAYGPLTISNSVFRNNVATGAGGAVAWFAYENIGLSITDTVFENNQALEEDLFFDEEFGGGAVLALVSDEADAASIELQNVAFRDNTAETFGGGLSIFVEDPDISDVSVELLDTSFSGNRVLLDDGGGAAIREVGSFYQLGGLYENNRAGYGGGGLYVLGSGSHLIEGTRFADNQAQYAGGGIAANASIAISGAEFVGNRVNELIAVDLEDGGGAISIAPSSFAFAPSSISASIESTIMEGNVAPSGGAIAAFNTSLVLVDSGISDNQTTDPNGGGGGIVVVREIATDDVFLDVVTSSIRGNISAGDAGGIGAVGAFVKIVESIIDSNRANDGSGGGIGLTTSGDNRVGLELENSTISRNFAAQQGGGIGVIDAELQTFQATISDNEAVDAGGGIAYLVSAPLLSSSQIIFSTIASNRTDGSGSNVFSLAEPLLFASSLIADPRGGGPGAVNFGGDPAGVESIFFNLDSDGSGNFSSPGDLSNVDPRLGPLADNGGLVETRALLPGSPAIDGSGTSPLTFDTRGPGFPRLQDGNADGEGRNDIGAFEAAALTLEAVPDTATVASGQSVLVPVLDNDMTNQPPLRLVALTTSPSNGVAVIQGDQVLYTPAPGFTGTDSFIYSMTNSPAGVDTPTSSAEVTINVVGDLTFVPDPAVATFQSTPLEIDGTTLTSNDLPGPGGGPVTIQSVQAGTLRGGTVTLIGQTIRYVPAPTFAGVDTITYTITDGTSTEPGASLDVTVSSLPPGLIDGRISCDFNGNYMVDPDELIAGVRVFLDFNGDGLRQSTEPETFTDASGRYSFAVPPILLPATISVVAEVPSGCRTITPLPWFTPALGVGLIARDIAAAPRTLSGSPTQQQAVVVNEIGGDVVFTEMDATNTLRVVNRVDVGGRLTSLAVFPSDSPAVPPQVFIGDVAPDQGGRVIVVQDGAVIREIAVPDGPIDLQVADFDGDGLPDVVMMGLRQSQASLIWGGTETVLPLGELDGLVSTVIGDFSGNGLPDIAIAGRGYGDGSQASLQVLLNLGNRSFQPIQPVALGSQAILQVQSADVLDSGRDALLVLSRGGRLRTLALVDQELQVLDQNQLDPTASRFVTGNFNGDRFPDVAYARRQSPEIGFLVGRPGGGFAHYSEAYSASSPTSMTVADLTGDGIDELVVVTSVTPCDTCAGGVSQPPSTVQAFRLNVGVRMLDVSFGVKLPADFFFPSADPELLLDVDRDGQVTPADALLVINALHRDQAQGEDSAVPPRRFDTDVNRDGQTTPLDALLVINWLNRSQRAVAAQPRPQGEPSAMLWATQPALGRTEPGQHSQGWLTDRDPEREAPAERLTWWTESPSASRVVSGPTLAQQPMTEAAIRQLGRLETWQQVAAGLDAAAVDLLFSTELQAERKR